MDIGDMDVEDFQHAWRQARDVWTQANQHKLEAATAGRTLSAAEQAAWLAAQAQFQEYERAWDDIFRAGVVVIVEGDDGDR